MGNKESLLVANVIIILSRKKLVKFFTFFSQYSHFVPKTNFRRSAIIQMNG